ncbi:MAG: serine hydrolase domain-containing protein [Bacteroides sp.]|nr:serine hydrolase domain-containing protein [Bacteroides sp.]
MKKLNFFFVSLLVISNCSSAQSYDRLNQSLDSILSSYYQKGKFNGNVLVAIDDRVIFHKSYGFADLNKAIPLDTNSVFCLASLSKIFTASAILMLEAEGKLSIEDRIRKFLPELPTFYNPVKIKHLLSHTSGIPIDQRGWQSKIDTDNSDVMAFLVSQNKLESFPGEKYRYSNEGFNLLAMIVEKTSGQSFPEFVEEVVFSKLNMGSSFVRPAVPGEAREHIVSSYVNGSQADWPLFSYGPGGVYSTTGDLAKWDKAFFNFLVLSEAAVAKALTPVRVNEKPQNYGYGWGIISMGGKTIAGHTGGMFGFRNLYERQLEDKVTIIILSNIGDETPLMAIREQINRQLVHVLN